MVGHPEVAGNRVEIGPGVLFSSDEHTGFSRLAVVPLQRDSCVTAIRSEVHGIQTKAALAEWADGLSV